MQDPRRTGVASHGLVAEKGRRNGTSHRVLSVDEALQYSPFSSTTAYGLDCITLPQVGRPGPSTLFSTPNEHASAKQTVKNLDDDLKKKHGKSTYLDSSLEQIQRLLDGDELTEFKFKLPSNHTTEGTQGGPGLWNGTPDNGLSLSPFAKMVLNSTDVAFRYPTPFTPSPKSTKKRRESKQPAAVTPNANGMTHREENEQASAHNSPLPTPKSASSIQGKPQPMVVVPSLPALSQYSSYVELPSAEGRPPQASGQSKQSSNSRVRDREKEADAALFVFQDLLQSVFDAEDHLLDNAPSIAAPDGSSFFVPTTTSENCAYAIAPPTHFKLQSHIQKVVDFDRFNDVPLDDLLRLQSLCERPLLAFQTISLKLDSGPSESDVEDWLQKVELGELSLTAAGTLIRMMMANREEKELRSEENILSIPKVLNDIFEDSIIPLVEARSQGHTSDLFAAFSVHKKTLESLMKRAKKVLTLLSTFMSKIEVVEEAITTTEFLATKLLFVENARSEKESVLGIAKYEVVRRDAMDALAKIFSKYPEQRSFILDEILASLEKLPPTQKNARQYKLADGSNIQLLTALVMQLVQTTTLQGHSFSPKKRRRVLNSNGVSNADAMNVDEQDDGQSEDDLDQSMVNGANDSPRAIGSNNVSEALAAKVGPLHDNATRSAHYVVTFFVRRAMTSTKSGDDPYRKLLDLFTGDLITVLKSPDWPAAELLLRLLASHMIGITNHDKSTALAKNMAIEVLGTMGAAMCDTISTLQHFGATIDRAASKTSHYLNLAIDRQLQSTNSIEDVIEAKGPFRIALEYLRDNDHADSSLSSARSFLLVQWARTVSLHLEVLDEEGEDGSIRSRRMVEEVATILVKMLSDPKWLETESDFDNVSPNEGRAAYNLAIINLGFCKAYDAIANVLLSSLTSDQIKIRDRSLKSVETMVEKDPKLLDRQSDVIRVIFRSASDPATSVRESAISLIGKCILLKPALEVEACRVIMNATNDQSTGVRKKCIELLKEVYLRNSRMDVRSTIAETLLFRMKDDEEKVGDLARQTIENAWITPYIGLLDSLNDSAKAKVAFKEHANLIVKCIQRGGKVILCFVAFLGNILSESSRNAAANFKVCRALVGTMFEALAECDPGDIQGKYLLETITIFAKADAKLFSPEQVRFLQPYIEHLTTNEELVLFRYAVVIFRRVLPSLSATHEKLLQDTHTALFKSLKTLGRAETDEVMACEWSMSRVIDLTSKMVNLTKSVLGGIYVNRDKKAGSPEGDAVLKAVGGYIRIAGSIGKCWDLEKNLPFFKKNFPWWNGSSVAELMVDLISPRVSSSQPTFLRVEALESLGAVCQSWPAQLGRDRVRGILDAVFTDTNAQMQNIVMKTFAEIFAIHEGMKKEKIANVDGPAEGGDTFASSMKATDYDVAAAKISEEFLPNIIQVCCSRQDQYALTAMEVIASIGRSGRAHPQKCAGTWVAAETSTNKDIARIAYETHKQLHSAHSSIFEREYMRAVHGAFVYQRDVVGDSSGATRNPSRSKLWPLFDIVKISNFSYQKKFLSNLCSSINFIPAKLDCSAENPYHLLFARFLIQNLVFFEYARMDELVHVISCMEKVVAETGTGIAHAIDTEIFKNAMDTTEEEQSGASLIQPTMDHGRLRRLTTSSMILSMLWEGRTFLRRQYGVTSAHSNREKKGNQAKDMTKAPARVQGVTGDRFWEALSRIMEALTNEETMTAQCQKFSELLSVDDELKLAAENEGDRESLESGSLDLDEDGTPGPGPMKRKGSRSVSGTPKKLKKRGRPSLGGKRKSSNAFNDDADGWD